MLSLFTRFAIAAAFFCSAAWFNDEPTSTFHTYDSVKIAEGIQGFIASESNNLVVSGNSVAIIGDNGVLVVDTTNFPSHARKMIGEIKKLTDQPVRYIVHTHWHPDHWMGDSEYRAAFPDVQIISTAFTRKMIAELGSKYLEGTKTQGKAYGAKIRKMLQDGKDEKGEVLSEHDRQFNSTFADSIDFITAEYSVAKLVVPNVAFDRFATIYLGHREVQLLFLGRGNTAGDAVIYVPDAKVVMTGDLLVAPTPYSFGSYLTEWVQTLANVKALGAITIVPGHGPVEHDTHYLDLVSSLLQSTTSQVQQAVKQGLDLEATRKQINLADFQTKFAGTDPDRIAAFKSGYEEQAVARAFQEAHGKFEEEH